MSLASPPSVAPAGTLHAQIPGPCGGAWRAIQSTFASKGGPSSPTLVTTRHDTPARFERALHGLMTPQELLAPLPRLYHDAWAQFAAQSFEMRFEPRPRERPAMRVEPPHRGRSVPERIRLYHGDFHMKERKVILYYSTAIDPAFTFAQIVDFARFRYTASQLMHKLGALFPPFEVMTEDEQRQCIVAWATCETHMKAIEHYRALSRAGYLVPDEPWAAWAADREDAHLEIIDNVSQQHSLFSHAWGGAFTIFLWRHPLRQVRDALIRIK